MTSGAVQIKRVFDLLYSLFSEDRFNVRNRKKNVRKNVHELKVTSYLFIDS